MRTRNIAFCFPLPSNDDLTVTATYTSLPWSEGSDRYDIDIHVIIYKKDDILPVLQFQREELGECRLLDKIEEAAQEACYQLGK